MKIVRENINFERGKDPKSAMGIGSRKAIRDWFEDLPFTVIENSNYIINDDLSVSVSLPLDFIGLKNKFPDGRLPEYIRFGKVSDLDVDDCGLVSLEGFPIECSGYFSCQMNKLKSLEGGPVKVDGGYFCNGNPGKFTEDYVRSICEVGENIQADDTEEW